MHWPEDYVDKVICEDCNEVMKRIPRESIGLIVTDPPFAISSEVIITRGRNKMKFKGPDIVMNFGDWDKFSSFDDYLKFTFQWVDRAVQLLKKGRLFVSYFDRDKINFLSHYLQGKYKFKLKGYYADCKSNPVPQARKVKWMNGWEILGMWQKPDGKLIYNYQLGQHKDYGIRPIVGGKVRTKHPTQKPLKVIRDFIAYWSNENDIILDPFLGSGTTAVAAKELNRHFIGIEKDAEYCKIARKRLAQGILKL